MLFCGAGLLMLLKAEAVCAYALALAPGVRVPENMLLIPSIRD